GVDKITSGASKYLTYKPNNAACTDGQILSWDNTNTRWVCANDANSGGTVTSITAGTGLTGGAITGSGTIGLGTELTGVNGLSTTGFVQRTGAGAYSTASASTTASNNTLVQRDGSGVSNFYGVGLTGATSGTVTLQAPATVTPYSVTWPSGVAGAANSVLASDTSGNLSWINLGSVAGNINLTSQVTGALPIANGGTNATTAAGARTNLGLGTIATLNSGSAAGNVPVLGTGGLVANQMCTSDGTASGVICTSTIPTSSQWTTSSSNIYFNTGNVGIGTTSPGHTLEVIGFSSGGASAPMITLQQTNAGANANINPAMAIYNYMGTATTGGPSQQFYNARGTSSSATATQSGDSLGTFSGNGYNGSAFNQAASIGFVATGAFSGTSTPAGIYFQTTPSGSTTAVERMRIDSTGYVGIGTSSPSTPLHIFNSTGGARIDTPWSTWGLHLLATDGTTTGTSPSLVLEDVDGGRIRLRKESSSLYVLNTADEYRHKLGGSSTSSSYFANGGGNVGIGTNTPTNKLHVSGGAIVADAQSSSTQCVNFATGNIQVSSYNGTNTINIGGVADGGAYTLVLTGYTSGQTVTVNGYTDTACSSAVTTGVDFGGSSSAVTNTFTAAGNTQLLTFIYSSARGVVYGSAATNFYH
ncbi:MAG: beta strand repeat-containing protein, partial [Pseudobdellovibrionaceae bacterium]